MKTGFFATHYLWPVHFETDLELMQLSIDKKDETFLFHCDESIKQCELIWHRAIQKKQTPDLIREITCTECQLKQKMGISLLSGNFNKAPLISTYQKQQTYTPDINFLINHQSIKKLVVDGQYEIGWSMLSSVISMTRNPFIDLTSCQQDLLNLYQDCCRIYYSTKEYIKKYGLERVYVFNGRFSYTKAVLSAARSMNIDCYVHERGAVLSKYSLFQNHTIHNIAAITREINQLWESEKDIDKKMATGEQFFIDRENNIIGSWHTFLDNQDINKLPENWDDGAYNFTLFTSSEDEFSSISDEWNIPLFKTQTEGIRYVATIISKMPDAHLYIRIHPNVKTMAQEYKASLQVLGDLPQVTLINHDSDISSYQLLKNSSKIISFGSTMGIEAVYWKVPSILLGKSLYYHMQGPFIPASLRELEDLLYADELAIPSNIDAIKFGFFMKSFGINFKYYQGKGVIDGLFKNVNLNTIKTKRSLLKNRVLSTYRNLFNID